jgi:tRNA(Arg) A34 adenosine deaminase TadA
MNHHDYMKIALQEAAKAAKKDEVPVGALVVNPATGEIIAKAHNLSEHAKNAVAHAEIEVMQKACRVLKQKRLWSMYLYVTLEPCTMCSAAASFMRIEKIIFGTEDKKNGAICNGVSFYNADTCHHKPEIERGIMAEESAALLKEFFKKKRRKPVEK